MKILRNIYYFFVTYLYFFACVTVVIIVIMAILFVIEKIMPDKVHVLNYAITKKTVEEMISGHHYNQAIFLLEHKSNMIADVTTQYEFLYTLYDCYMQIGEFAKAEKTARQIESENISKAGEISTDSLNDIFNFNKLIMKRDFLKIYEKIGNISKIQSTTSEMDSLYNKIDIEKISEQTALPQNGNNINIIDAIRFDIIKGTYATNKGSAIDSLSNLVEAVYPNTKYNHGFKIKLMNQLLKWLIEGKNTIKARYVLHKALDLAEHSPKDKKYYEPMGELSEYCMMLNDIPSAQKMLRLYKLYIDEYCTNEDFDYYIAKTRLFRYLEIKGQHQELEDEVTECCQGIKQHILNNLAGMTATQREYFIRIMHYPFSYAEKLMQEKTSDNLTKLCFENKCFEKGILMRSSLNVKNAVEAIGDTALTSCYNAYLDMRQELTARQYMNGPGNYIRKKELEAQIEEIETRISEQSEDFARSCKYNYSTEYLSAQLAPNEAIALFIDNGKDIAVYILKQNNEIQYIKLADQETINNEIRKYANIYANEDLTHILWDKIRNCAPGIQNIYYTADGIISKIALDALPTSNGGVLGDDLNLCLLTDPGNIDKVKAQKTLELKDQQISIWGGISYSDKDTIYMADTNSYAMRGNELKFLKGSLDEVSKIYETVREIPMKAHLYLFGNATEKSFLSRNGQNDAILHISTHGFFQENHLNNDEYNPMHNSGLFFSGANQYWTNDSTTTDISEHDGILRAEEIENCNLSGCQLVVLSACETGLGHTSSSEGVYGLQRAFKLAGADMVIMSLWNVDDKATCDLMVSFYNNLAHNGDPDKALLNAKQSIRAQGKDTYYWGGFILLH